MERQPITLVLLLFSLSACLAIDEETSWGTGALKELRAEMTRMQQVISQQQSTIDAQNHQLAVLERSTRDDMRNVTARVTTVEQRQRRTNPGGYYELNAVGCLQEVVTLTCPANTYINVTGATYGQYATTCSTCCFPQPADCSEDLETSHPGDWAGLKQQCDEKSVCEHLYTGEVIDGCESGYVADYMQVFYDCLGSGQEPTDPVGFTTYLVIARDYIDGEVIIFDEIVTNIGGYYSPTSGLFTCPYSGAYLFSVNVLADAIGGSLGSGSAWVAIYVEETLQVATYAEKVSSDEWHNAHASTFAIAECQAGQTASVRADRETDIYGDYSRLSSFSGYLLSRYV